MTKRIKRGDIEMMIKKLNIVLSYTVSMALTEQMGHLIGF